MPISFTGLLRHGLGVFGERHRPLRRVLGVAPGRPHRFHIGLGAFPECGDAIILGARGFGIAAGRQYLTQLRGLTPRLGERQVAPAANAEFGALAVPRIHENPTLPALLVDEQIEATAIGMASRLTELRGLRRA